MSNVHDDNARMIDTPFEIAQVEPARPQIETWQHGTVWRGVSAIDIPLGDAHWYGMGGLVHQQWPLEKLALYEAPFITSDNGHTGLLGILEPLWWTSTGQGLWVADDALRASFNAPLAGSPPAHSFQDPAFNDQRPPLAARVTATDGLLRIRGDDLTLYFFDCDDPRQVIEAFWKWRGIAERVRGLDVPSHLLEKPLWTTWAHFKNDISHAQIVDYARQLQEWGFTASVFGIDAKWQQEFGDTRFDRAKFPDPAATIAALRQVADQVTLWCMPFFMESSMHFGAANGQRYTIQRPDGTPYIGEWWEGKAAFLDVTNPAAMDWHLDNLARLAAEIGLDGFKFDAGEAMFFDVPHTIRAADTPPNDATRRYIQQVAQRFPWSDVRTAWRNQGEPLLFRQWDKSTGWGYDNGLASCITQAIALNMIGYPVSFPDMIGGNEYGTQTADAELLIRWTQAVAPMPLIQFSIAPWREGQTCARLCREYAALHARFAEIHRSLLAQGQPLIGPLWWLAPHDETALACADQYLVGEQWLVAPVVERGATARDIYLPAGRWRSYWDAAEVHTGPCWLADYPAPLEVLPLFERIG